MESPPPSSGPHDLRYGAWCNHPDIDPAQCFRHTGALEDGNCPTCALSEGTIAWVAPRMEKLEPRGVPRIDLNTVYDPMAGQKRVPPPT